MDRRDFFKASLLSAGLIALGDWEEAFARGTKHPEAGKIWKGWKKGQFQIHVIYTGVCESLFLIFPDGTTMLLDCGDHDVEHRKNGGSIAILPDKSRHSGEWISRYVSRVNPHGTQVDYMMLSHYHNDHCGDEVFYASSDGDYHYGGFSQAAQFLHFGKAFDRAWPGMDDPLPVPDNQDNGSSVHIRKFYQRMLKEGSLTVERFRLGAIDQIAMLHNPDAYKDFSIRNICANGRIAYPDGTIRDLYADRIKAKGLAKVNENGMSLGMVISYGPFRFYTAGDFSDKWTLDDGTVFWIEDALAEVCGPCNVAKINHHGHYSMPPKLVAALRSQVYINCVWNERHTVSDVMDTLADRNLYPEDRIVCPGLMPPQRMEADKGKAWMNTLHPSAPQGGHVVVTVEKGGEKFSVTYITAVDESMTVCSVMDFETRKY